MQNNPCGGRARSHRHQALWMGREGFASKVLHGYTDLTGASGLPQGQHGSCWGISFLGREQ